MQDRVLSTDPLRLVDPRYEPRDPLFDPELEEEPPRLRRSLRKRRPARAARDPLRPAIE